jgi:hypothetical protein
VLRLGIPPTLARTLRSTNAIESMIGICREHAKNVTRWRDDTMALRWAAAGMLEAGKQFRRVNGHLHLPALRTALQAEAHQTVGPSCMMKTSTQPDQDRAATEVSTNFGTTSPKKDAEAYVPVKPTSSCAVIPRSTRRRRARPTADGRRRGVRRRLCAEIRPFPSRVPQVRPRHRMAHVAGRAHAQPAAGSSSAVMSWS